MCFWSVPNEEYAELLADLPLGGRDAPLRPIAAEEIEYFFLLQSESDRHINRALTLAINNPN